MKIDIKDLPEKILALLAQLKRYVVIIFLVSFAILSMLLIVKINQLTQREPSEDAISEKVNLQKLRTDQSSVNKLNQLKVDTGQATTPGARENPFSE